MKKFIRGLLDIFAVAGLVPFILYSAAYAGLSRTAKQNALVSWELHRND